MKKALALTTGRTGNIRTTLTVPYIYICPFAPLFYRLYCCRAINKTSQRSRETNNKEEEKVATEKCSGEIESKGGRKEENLLYTFLSASKSRK